MTVCNRPFILVLLLPILFACSKKVSHEKHIPSNAAMVAVLDVRKMTIKAFDMSLLLEENLLDRKQKEESQDDSGIPIEESGIDFLDKSYVIGHVADNEADNYIGFIMPISDPGRFRKFARSYAIKPPGEGATNVSYVIIGDGAILGWNNESAIYLLNQNVSNEKALTAELYRLFDLPESNQLILQNESFQNSQTEEFDISVWMDINKLNKYRNPLGMIIPGQRVSKGIYNAWINFEKGQLNVKTKYYTNTDEKGKRDGALLLKESVDKDLLSGLEDMKVLGSLNLGLNMPQIKEQMRKDQMLDSSHSYLELMNTNTEEVLDMLSGDFVSALIENGNKTEFYIALGIKNPESSAKIIQSLSDLGIIRDNGDYFTLFREYIIFEEKDRLVLSSSADIVENQINNNLKLPAMDFVEELDTNPMVFYLNLDEMPKKSYRQMKSYWKAWPINSDEIEELYFVQASAKNGVSEGKAHIIFKNKDKNSLTIIAKSLKQISRNIES